MSPEPTTPGPAPQPADSPELGTPQAMAAAPLKTPLFQAMNAARYQRQSLIRRIEKRTGRPLICYVATASVTRDDTLGFVDLLHNLRGPLAVDLLLHTPGGDIDAAEKLMSMVRTKVGDEHLRVIVPDFAKSAGTLMVLAADSVLMSDSSELGPIDPQVVSADATGNRRTHSVQDYLDAYEQFKQELTVDPHSASARLMLSKIEPATVKRFEAALSRARAIAEKHLRQGMFRKGGLWSAAAGELLDTRRWKSHGQMISWEDAIDTRLGLHVEHVLPDDDLWCDLWQLYCLQRLAIEDKQKLFESDFVSIPMDSVG